tara:strand:+ start:42 stop:272 length:231 start_codon:yes stop_codon:yes gene_type:complete
MSYDLKAKDLTSYGRAIDAASTIEEAKSIFIEMVENFDFKSKQKRYITEAKIFSKSKLHFSQWTWNIILKSEGLGV